MCAETLAYERLTTMSSLRNIQVPVRMTVDDKTRHFAYENPRSEREKRHSLHKSDLGGATCQETLQIQNGRDQDVSLTLDEASFELVHCPTVLSTQDFYELYRYSYLRERYYKEVSDFLKAKLGCDKVVCFYSVVRNQAKYGEQPGVYGYEASSPHTESSPISSDELALSLAEGDGGEYRRYMHVHLWRNISDIAVQNHHLAVLDERSTVKPDDYVVRDVSLDGSGSSVVQYGLNARHTASHQWYYFPDMTKQEVILLKQMDSDWTKPGRMCFHMSVQDESLALADLLPPRESIEVRCMCYWKQASVNSMPTQETLHPELMRDPFALAEMGSLETSATAWELIQMLIAKIPWFGKYVAWLFFGRTHPSQQRLPYTGRPRDYLTTFVQAVEAFGWWPEMGKTMLMQQQQQQPLFLNSSTLPSDQEGISSITRTLVEDRSGSARTRHLSPSQKQEIVAFLLSNETYMSVCRKQWAIYAQA